MQLLVLTLNLVHRRGKGQDYDITLGFATSYLGVNLGGKSHNFLVFLKSFNKWL